MLKGIGSNGICTTVQILSNVKIDGSCNYILFHVIGDDHMQNDIVIGREILNKDFDIVQFTITIAKIINVCTGANQPILILNLRDKIT